MYMIIGDVVFYMHGFIVMILFDDVIFILFFSSKSKGFTKIFDKRIKVYIIGDPIPT